MDFSEAERRLGNWGRWSNANGSASHTCGSAEKNYRAPASGLEVEKFKVLDVGDAMVVERAMTGIHSQRQEYRCLVEVYVKARRPEELSRRWKIPVTSVKQLKTRGVMLVSDRLETLDRQALLIRKGKLFWAGLAR